MSALAFLGPTPGRSISTLVPAMRSRGFSARRKKASRIFHVRGLYEAQAAVLAEGYVAPRKLHLQGQAVVRGAKKNGLAAEVEAGLAVVQYRTYDELSLLVLVVATDELRLCPALAVRPKGLGVPLGGAGYDLVGGVENRLTAAVVLF